MYKYIDSKDMENILQTNGQLTYKKNGNSKKKQFWNRIRGGVGMGGGEQWPELGHIQAEKGKKTALE